MYITLQYNQYIESKTCGTQLWCFQFVLKAVCSLQYFLSFRSFGSGAQTVPTSMCLLGLTFDATSATHLFVRAAADTLIFETALPYTRTIKALMASRFYPLDRCQHLGPWGVRIKTLALLDVELLGSKSVRSVICYSSYQLENSSLQPKFEVKEDKKHIPFHTSPTHKFGPRISQASWLQKLQTPAIWEEVQLSFERVSTEAFELWNLMKFEGWGIPNARVRISFVH